jgi:putative phage-type endonuclease
MIGQYLQGTSEWLEMKKTHIGSSEISAITGNSPYKSALDLWKEKTNRKEPDPINAYMQHGIDTEPLARDHYMELTNIPMASCVMQYDLWDVAIASLDGLSPDGKIALEIKCPKSLRLYELALKGKIPKYYQDQIQWQLMISKAERCDYMVYIDQKQFCIIQVLPDKKYQDNLLAQAKEFWAYVLIDQEPPIKDEYEREDSEYINKMVAEWRDLKEQEAALKEKRDGLEKLIKSTYAGKKILFAQSGVRLNSYDKEGSIDWDAVTVQWQINKSDLEAYRKSGSKVSALTIVD